MSSRKVIMLLLAFFVGVGVFMAFRSSQQPGGDIKAAAPVQAVEVLAAAHDLPMGTILKDMDMKWIPWAQEAQNSRLYFKDKTDMKSLDGAVVRVGMHADEPILSGNAVQSHEQGFLAAVLTPGMRAVSVKLTPSAGVAGFVFPGDRVDVILTHRFSVKDTKNNDTSERHLSETLIENVRVLALDQKSDDQSNDPKVAQLATLEVTPQQAEKLMLAVEMSSERGSSSESGIALVLRSLATGDDAASSGKLPAPVMDSDVSPAFSRLAPPQTVQVMRGKDVSEATFQRQK